MYMKTHMHMHACMYVQMECMHRCTYVCIYVCTYVGTYVICMHLLVAMQLQCSVLPLHPQRSSEPAGRGQC